jgi:hypothetical protein
MPAMTLNPESLVVESFPVDERIPGTGRPRTYEPGCTLPELCGTGVA